ncbi:MAG: hypothetical protein IJ379_14775 [Lachnospiraceae bacterium]|nr:hypothetical protein [Lachnospiraceae bacterium]MBQ7777179.1 hypothetical protein [Lachnospiraceae bacterium]
MKRKANSLILDKACLEAARKQFCLDIGLSWEEYVANRDKSIFIQKSVYASGTLDIANEGARNYAERDSFFRAIICLGQLFICCDERIYDWVVEQYAQCKPEWFCGYKNLRKLDGKLQEYGHRILDTHVYFLPEDEGRGRDRDEETSLTEAERIARVSDMCNVAIPVFENLQEELRYAEIPLVWYEQEEILRFRENNRFSSAISFWARHPDVLAVVQMKDEYRMPAEASGIGTKESAFSKDFDQSHMAGMAGVSLDGEYLWQIGINVDEECAGLGIGHRLVRALKEEVLKRGKVPFYGTSESHTVSQTVGLKAGFVPAWTEVSVEQI